MDEYETLRDQVVLSAWERWTKNGLGLDFDDREQTLKSVRDAAANTYQEGFSATEWIIAILSRLEGE